jgi:hypothetical protein
MLKKTKQTTKLHLALILTAFTLLGCQLITNILPDFTGDGEPFSGKETNMSGNLAATESATPQITLTGTVPFLSQLPTDTSVQATASISLTETPLPSSTTNPSATVEPPTRFAVIGDYGLAGNPERDVANMVKSWEPEFIITTGDNNYPDGMPETVDENIGQYYQEFIHPYVGEYGEGADINRFFPTMGNHDWSITQGKTYLDYFTLPGNERYYEFTWGPLHFFALDSDSREPDGVGRTSVQAKWLKQELETSTATWKIVYMHHPPYTSGGEDGPIEWMQWPYKEWGATAVIAGHAHVYERIMVDGFPYFVNGLGGGPRYSFHDTVPGSEVRYRKDYGAMLVEATTDWITFQFITRGGEVIDTFDIQNNP